MPVIGGMGGGGPTGTEVSGIPCGIVGADEVSGTEVMGADGVVRRDVALGLKPCSGKLAGDGLKPGEKFGLKLLELLLFIGRPPPGIMFGLFIPEPGRGRMPPLGLKLFEFSPFELNPFGLKPFELNPFGFMPLAPPEKLGPVPVPVCSEPVRSFHFCTLAVEELLRVGGLF